MVLKRGTITRIQKQFSKLIYIPKIHVTKSTETHTAFIKKYQNVIPVLLYSLVKRHNIERPNNNNRLFFEINKSELQFFLLFVVIFH